MLRAAIWTLRQRRYAALAVVMAFLALVCAVAGTFELHRFQQKRHDNGVLRVNAHAVAVPLTTAVVPFVEARPVPTAPVIRFRTVTATGRYLADQEHYVAGQSQGGRQGFYVLTPLRTSSGVLLVVRGFVAAKSDETRPTHIAAPPAGVVQVAGRLEPAQTGSDKLGRLGRGEITSINPAEQAVRLGAPTYDAYVTLTARALGTSGLSVVPTPDLSNPTGGAGELQLFSYIVQWYVFGLLALIAPFLFSRAEVRDAQRRFLGIDPDAVELGLEPSQAPRAVGAAPASAGAVAVRTRGDLAQRDGLSAQRLQRATRLADRYGRSLGLDNDVTAPDIDPADSTPSARDRSRAQPGVATATANRRSAAEPHRSGDGYHGSYNDYLWQLALADGEAPDVRPAAGDRQRPEPRIVEGSVRPDDDEGSDASTRRRDRD